MIFDWDAFEFIKHLCENSFRGSESHLLEELRYVLATNPDAAKIEMGVDGYRSTLLHYAVFYDRSVGFCKLLVGLNPDLIKTTDNDGDLPIHIACSLREKSTVDIIDFLLELYPESINLPGSEGRYPIHCYLESNDEPELNVLQFLLERDQGAVSKPDVYGMLPLHNASESYETVGGFQLVFNAYPQAVYIRNLDDETPLDIVRSRGENICEFLEYQLELVNQARQVTTPDDNGQLPLHQAVQNDDASLGTVKLMVEANPNSTSVADNGGMIPLHIACQVGDIDATKFLIEINRELLNISDLKGNFALHHACSSGNCDVVNSIMKETTNGVCTQNMDGMLPIEIWLCNTSCDRQSQEFIEALFHLLCAHPDALIGLG